MQLALSNVPEHHCGTAELAGQSRILGKKAHYTDSRSAVSIELLCTSSLSPLLVCLQVKKGALAETSPMMNDISGVPKWEKVSDAVCVPVGRLRFFSVLSPMFRRVVLSWVFVSPIRPCQIPVGEQWHDEDVPG